MTTDAVATALETLIDAFRAHAAAVTAAADDDATFNASIALRDAAAAYDDAISDAGGIVPVLFDDFDDEDDYEPLELADPEVLRLSLEVRWDFVVRDVDAFVAYARERFRAAAPTVTDEHVDEHVGEAAGALAELFLLDGDGFAAPYRAHGLDEAGSGYGVDVITRTLWEMTADERDATGR